VVGRYKMKAIVSDMPLSTRIGGDVRPTGRDRSLPAAQARRTRPAASGMQGMSPPGVIGAQTAPTATFATGRGRDLSCWRGRSRLMVAALPRVCRSCLCPEADARISGGARIVAAQPGVHPSPPGSPTTPGWAKASVARSPIQIVAMAFSPPIPLEIRRVT
jgi:hypothetical protein